MEPGQEKTHADELAERQLAALERIATELSTMRRRALIVVIGLAVVTVVIIAILLRLVSIGDTIENSLMGR